MSASFRIDSKDKRFSDFVDLVQHCSLCPRLRDRTKVMSSANGNIDSKVLFVAEAPGRLGADRTGVPLCGDKTGGNFEALLGNIGWKREEVFITNAVLCNPRQANGTNDTPYAEEIANCAPFLEMIIQLVEPEVVVSLGITALKAIELIAPHRRSLRDAVGRPLPWAGRTLVPLYHPAPRALVKRSVHKQRADFMMLAKLVDPRRGLLQKTAVRRADAPLTIGGGAPSKFQQVVCSIVQSLGRITYFKLTKLLYLIDFAALEKFRETVTGEIYLRQPDGPWPPALQKQIKPLENREVILSSRKGIPMIEPGPCQRFTIELDERALEVISDILGRYGTLLNTQMKSIAYRTKPMRYILKEESRGRDMRRVAVIYKDKISAELDQLQDKH
jgi:uracil-DNA glycosylase family 4